ncbi:MAG: ParA family protein [Salinisphaeraceae bacterium]
MIRLSLPQKKGGVGKTTLVRILGEWFSRHKRVLLVDFDAQCSLSSMYLNMDRVGTGRRKRPPIHPEFNPSDPEMSEWSGRSSTADIFYRDRIVERYEIAETEHGKMDILPADSRELVHVSQIEADPIRSLVEQAIPTFFSDEALSDLYDIVIFDTSPSDSPLLRGVIRASSHIIVPMEPEQHCVDSLDEMVGSVLEEQQRRPKSDPLTMLGLQVNKYQKVRSIHQGLLQRVRDTEGLAEHLSPVIIPNRTAYAERDVRGLLPRSIFDVKPSDPARKVAEQWCTHVESQLFPERGHAAKR